LLILRDADAKQRLGRPKYRSDPSGRLGLSIAVAQGGASGTTTPGAGLQRKHSVLAKKKYRMLLDGVQDYAILMLDPRGRVASWNAGPNDQGLQSDEIIGRIFSRFYLQADIDQGKPEEELQAAAASGRSEIEHWPRGKDGSRFWGNTVITAVRTSSGSLLGFFRNQPRLHRAQGNGGEVSRAAGSSSGCNGGGKGSEIVLLNVPSGENSSDTSAMSYWDRSDKHHPEGFGKRLIGGRRYSKRCRGRWRKQIGTGIELIARRKDGN